MEKSVKKFIVFTTRRTGSSYLARYLNNHPNVRMHGEVFFPLSKGKDSLKYFVGREHHILHEVAFNKVYLKLYKTFHFKNNLLDRYTTDYLETFFRNLDGYYSEHNALNSWLNDVDYDRSQFKESAVGFKLMFAQLELFPSLVEWIVKNQISIVCLYRENLLKQYVSDLAKNKRGYAHSVAETRKVLIHLDIDECLYQIALRDRSNRVLQELFPDNPQILLTYEDFFQKMETEGARIFRFLEVEDLPIQRPPMTKQSSNQLEDLIENYEELSKKLKATAYYRFLDT